MDVSLVYQSEMGADMGYPFIKEKTQQILSSLKILS